MKPKKTTLMFKILKFILMKIYKAPTIEGLENIPQEPCIIVANHSQINGPICCELFFPVDSYIWAAAEMMHLKEVPAYAFKDFWSRKPKYIQWFFKIASYLIAPVSVSLFNNAHTIGVYHDQRIVFTFKNTIKKLNEGNNIVIFPEYGKEYNNIIYDFKDKFIDIAKLYYKKTGKEIKFVPMYIAPKLKKMYVGKPTKFDFHNEMNSERARIKKYLMSEITDIAVNLPEHTVIPYWNIPKKLYPSNKPKKENTNEKTGC